MNERRKSNTRPTAIALRYEGRGAPRLIAKGRGATAERIVELAKSHGIPMQHDPELVEMLAQMKLGEEIPPALYAAIAELLAFIYSVSDERQAQQENIPDSAGGAASVVRYPQGE